MIFVGAAFGGPPDYCKDCQRQPLQNIDFRSLQINVLDNAYHFDI